jgi:hypothetical protein
MVMMKVPMSYPVTQLYFESHVTIEPVFDERLDKFKQLAKCWGFRVADLLMQKRKEASPERSKFDTFATGRSTDYLQLSSCTLGLVAEAQSKGFEVWRYKIENTLVDVRLKTFSDPVKENALELGVS